MASVVSNASFLADFPEFSGATTDLVTSAIARAARWTNENVFQSTEQVNDAVKLKAAIVLIESPYGREMRSEAPEQILVYEMRLRHLQRAATTGLRVF